MENVLKELIKTERTYVCDLEVFQEEMVDALQKYHSFPQGDMTLIFSTIPLIIQYHQTSLKELNGFETNSDTNICSAALRKFFRHMEDEKFVSLYKLFCNHYHKAMEEINQISKRSKEFCVFINKLQDKPRCNSLTFADYMSKPFQRICKYPLLLRELLKSTPVGHQEYTNLLVVFNKIEQLVTEINLTKASADNLRKLIELMKTIPNLKELVPNLETFISEGTVQIITPQQNEKERHIFLFDSHLLFCKKKKRVSFKAKTALPLKMITLNDPDVNSSVFQITRTDTNKMYNILCKTQQEKQYWFDDFLKVHKLYTSVPMSKDVFETPLHIACSKGNKEEVETLVKKKLYNVNARDKNGWTPFICAAAGGHLHICHFLLKKKKLDFTLLTADNATALHYLVRHDPFSLNIPGKTPEEGCNLFLEVFKEAIKRGAPVNTLTKHNETCLHRACTDGNQLAVSYLLMNGLADMNIRNKFGETGLHIAQRRGHKVIVEVLLKHGADTSTDGILNMSSAIEMKIPSDDQKPKDKTDQALSNDLLSAARNENLEMIKAILSKDPSVILARDSKNRTILHIAAHKGHLDMVTVSINYKANINALDKYRRTPLHISIEQKHLKVSQLLVEAGCDLMMESSSGVLAFHKLLKKKFKNQALCIEVLRLMLKKGVKINHKVYKYGLTPLHYAVMNGINKRIVRFLLLNGADVNMTNNEGNTVLHFAIIYNRTKMISLLISFHPDISIRNNTNKTCLELAQENNLPPETLQMLEEYQQNQSIIVATKTPLHIAASEGFKLEVEQLLKQKVDVNASDKNGWTPLLCAAGSGQLEICELLLNVTYQKIDVLVTSSEDNTILHHLARVNPSTPSLSTLITPDENIRLYRAILSSLIQKGCPVNAQTTKHGETALHRASIENNTHAVTYLLENNADVNVLNKQGDTALQCAKKKGNKEVMSLLMKDLQLSFENSLSRQRSNSIEAEDKTPLSWVASTRPSHLSKTTTSARAPTKHKIKAAYFTLPKPPTKTKLVQPPSRSADQPVKVPAVSLPSSSVPSVPTTVQPVQPLSARAQTQPTPPHRHMIVSRRMDAHSLPYPLAPPSSQPSSLHPLVQIKSRKLHSTLNMTDQLNSELNQRFKLRASPKKEEQLKRDVEDEESLLWDDPTGQLEDLYQGFLDGKPSALHEVAKLPNHQDALNLFVSCRPLVCFEHLNSLDETGCSPLHHAANSNNLRLFRQMHVLGADPTLKNAAGLSPYSILSKKSSQPVDPVLSQPVGFQL
eukprot:TRINITY_DN5463_c0_g1_i1.p1 TRINITY_DN5463_c0_g1~~TRINITY_DN5463_c0_g1_i1.p1  ORF type:complete len:1264 (-),score=264.59 TRINITY_DN5463_c0_g1_i1:43-3834(-)